MALVLPVSLGAVCARADCPQWLPGQSVAGLNGSVTAMTTWDPDGPGPLPEVLVVAGNFTMAGNVPTKNIAIWDGAAWSALGTGSAIGTYPTSINALAVYDGKLYVGGNFSFTASNGTASNLAVWDGANWLAKTLFGEVRALCVHNGELIASGDFDTYGTMTMRRLGAYNGVSWREFGGGVASSPVIPRVYSLVSLGDTLYVGGRFTTAGGMPVNNIAAWRDGSWHTMDFGVVLKSGGDGVSFMLGVGDELFVAGSIELAGGTPVSNIAMWNGMFWETAGPGLPKKVRALCYFNGATIAATDDGIFQWSGWAWEPVASSPGDGPLCLTAFNGQLFAAGYFFNATPDGFRGIAKWNGGTWAGLNRGMPFPPDNLKVFGDRIYIGTSAELDTPALLAWEGASWFDPFSSADEYWSRITAIGTHEQELVVAGTLVPRNGNYVYGYTVARWRNGQWQRFGVAGAIINGPIYAIQSYNGDLVIGGNFSTVDQLNRRSLTRWDGTAWQDLGGQISGQVTSLAVFEGSLVLGGDFSYIAKVWMPSIASWTTTGFRPLGDGFSGAVRALAVYQGKLFAGGDFYQSGNVNVRGVGVWSGSKWNPISTSSQPGVRAMLADSSGLIIAGQFTFQPPTSSGIARWNGTTLSAFGSGLTSSAESIAAWRGEIVCAGNITAAGGKSTWGFARWSQTGVPGLAPLPKSLDAVCSSPAEFHAVLSPDYGPVSFSWKHNGNAITLNPTAATPTLIIDSVTHAHDGIYECVVSSACGTSKSTSSVLVTSCCPSDLDYNGLSDDADFGIFVTAYDALACDTTEMPPGCPADQNRDGFVDDADFVLFLVGYDALECP